MNRLMHGFPPQPQGQVTLTNWRSSPFNHWAFHHVREIIPSADIANDRHAVKHLPSVPLPLREVRVEPDSGEPLTIEAFLQETDHDGFAILLNGRLLYERYGNGMTEETPHILMSVSKSMLGLLAGFFRSLRGAIFRWRLFRFWLLRGLLRGPRFVFFFVGVLTIRRTAR